MREREVQNVLQTGVQFFFLLYGGFHTIDNRLLRTQNVVLVDSCSQILYFLFTVESTYEIENRGGYIHC